MDILLSIIGSAVLAALLSAAYTAGLCAGKAAAHMGEDDEPKIYMEHTHGGDEPGNMLIGPALSAEK